MTDFLEEPMMDDRMKEITFICMSEDGTMMMVTFAINPDMGYG